MKKGLFNEVNIKTNIANSPTNIIIPENFGNEAKGKTIAITEAMVQNVCQAAPLYLKLKVDFSTHFDTFGNRTSTLAIIPQIKHENGTTTYYRLDMVNPDKVFFGNTNSFNLYVTDPWDNVLDITGWSAFYVSIRINTI